MIALLLAAAMYPDAKLTPGVVATTDEKKVCAHAYSKDNRHVTPKMKREVFESYGFTKGTYKPGDWEIDHFISIENGGANDIKNLWPQPYKGKWTARMKDVVETNLHRRVCKGEITLKHAQEILRTDWIAEYKKLKGVK